MKIIVFVSIIFLFRNCFAFHFIDKYSLDITYDVLIVSKCRIEDDRFRRIFGIELSDCVRECGLRQHCKALSYRRTMQMCDLFTTIDGGNLSNGECIYISASDIKVEKKPCQICLYGQVCDVHSKSCKYAECLSKKINNGVVLGNANTVGSKIRYKCNHGCRNINSVKSAVCQENGKWNATADCEIDCGDPPSVQNGMVVLDRVYGTIYGDTATVTCDTWYHTKNKTIACTKTGIWENTTCTDCYVTTVGDYAGKRNWTVSGRTCQRWDASYPHSIPNRYTDPNNFPETTLQEASNYCRTPDTNIQTWCYTTDIDKDWENCDIPKCI